MMGQHIYIYIHRIFMLVGTSTKYSFTGRNLDSLSSLSLETLSGFHTLP